MINLTLVPILAGVSFGPAPMHKKTVIFEPLLGKIKASHLGTSKNKAGLYMI